MMSIRRLFCNKYVSYIFILWFVAVGWGCADDLSPGLRPDGNFLTIGFTVERSVLTRASAMAHESVVKDAYLLFFENSADGGNHLLSGYVKAEVQSAGQQLSFPVAGFLKKDTDYQIIALANADNYVPAGYDNYMLFLDAVVAASPDGPPTLEYIESAIEFHEDGRISYDSSVAGFLLPMEGSGERNESGNSTFRFSSTSGGYVAEGSLRFRRSVVRVDIVNDSYDKLRLESATVCNYRSSVKPLNPTLVCGGICGGKGDDLDSSLFSSIDSEAGMQSIAGEMYAFPNISQMNTIGDESSTGIIIKGFYIEDGVEDETPCYYRVNIGKAGELQALVPNTLYRLDIIGVRGRGCPTAEEAYGERECLIDIAADNGWNESGMGYAVDDDGNFIVVTCPDIVVPSDGISPAGSMVFASEKVAWEAESIGADDWYTVNKGINCIEVIAEGRNDGDSPREGQFFVVGKVDGNATLRVAVRVSQSAGSGIVDDWSLPEVALLPSGGVYNSATGKFEADHVAVSHRKNEDGSWTNLIEIDGFEPEAFNSFIDIPMTVHIEERTATSVGISNDLAWPMEGCLTREGASGLKYSWKSFPTLANPSVITPDLPSVIQNRMIKNDTFYISVGAMSPDDPTIIRNIVLKADNDLQIEYTVNIKPCPVIIDDVILRLEDGSYIMVCDRNLQDPYDEGKGYYTIPKWTVSGERVSQAYHYGTYKYMFIPEKFNSNGDIVYENQHRFIAGAYISYSKSRNEALYTTIFKDWRSEYSCEIQSISPFYTQQTIQGWTIPTSKIIDSLRNRILVSKMRMFIMSDLTTADGVPICCYLPHVHATGSEMSYPNYLNLHCYAIADENDTNGYGKWIYPDMNGTIIVAKQTVNNGTGSTDRKWMIRLIRVLSDEDLEMYKNGYLGYGDVESPLKPCKPDTWPYEQPYP